MIFSGNYGPLGVTVDFGSGQVSFGQSIQLTCTTTGYPAYAIRWKQGSNLITPSCKFSIVGNSLNTSILTIYNASISDVGTYECVAYSYYTADVNFDDDYVSIVGKSYTSLHALKFSFDVVKTINTFANATNYYYMPCILKGSLLQAVVV